MKALIQSVLRVVVPAAVLLLAGCGRTTTIKSDLVLDTNEGARIQLHQETRSMQLFNDSDAMVRVRVLGKRDRVVSDMKLNGHDQVRLDLANAQAVQFDNEDGRGAKIQWTLENDDLIEYSMAMNPTSP